jgi:hypothetical protein
MRNIPFYLLAGLLPPLFFVACAVEAAEDVDEAMAAVPAKAETGDEIPLVTLHTATTGRLPLRRQATGKLRARREVLIKSQTGGLLLRAPIEGIYYKKGDLLLATDPRPLELARDRAVAAKEEAAFRQRDLLLRLSTNLARKIRPPSLTWRGRTS